jgi:catechol 2,3-dioxygenase-like lactoylglutathione lyase family enzyme
MTIQHMDHVGIVVDDLAAATASFVELGLKLRGEGPVEGGQMDRVVGLEGVRAEIAMRRPRTATTSTPSSLACELAARNSLATWSATKTAIGSATYAARRG